MKRSFDIKLLRFYLLVSLGLLVLMFLHHLSNYPETVGERTLNDTWRLPYLIIINYTLFEYVLPFIGRKRQTILYNILVAIPVVFLYMMLYSFGLYAWRSIGVGLHIFTPIGIFKTRGLALANQMAFSMMAVFIFGISRHVNNYIKLKRDAQQLRIEKKEAELNYLKSQTNPHFLFNTLNNIYSLAKDKNDLAPESILRLSKILRFMLYETTGQYIAIENEIKIITDYIELEKLRYDESLRINFNHDVEDMKQALPPLLLIPLVENAFKHGVSETRGYPFIDIHLSVHNRQLVFVVKNSSEAYGSETVKENIGLSNLRRQLQLLYTGYDLSVNQVQTTFTATLKIDLSSHV